MKSVDQETPSLVVSIRNVDEEKLPYSAPETAAEERINKELKKRRVWEMALQTLTNAYQTPLRPNETYWFELVNERVENLERKLTSGKIYRIFFS